MRRATRVRGKTSKDVLHTRPSDRDEALEENSSREVEDRPDALPGATLTLIGHFVAQHKEEILSLVRNVEQMHTAENLGRIVSMNERKDGSILIRFTAPLLARRVGEALHSHYWGELELEQMNDGSSLRMTWWR